MYGYGIDPYENIIQNSMPIESNNVVPFYLIALIVSVCFGIVLYTLFMDKDSSKKYSGFTKKLYNFLNFDLIILEKFIKISYIIGTCFITVMSFSYIKVGLEYFLGILFLGNISWRVLYEVLIIFYKNYLNIKEIKENAK